jgi:hypothetical protein
MVVGKNTLLVLQREQFPVMITTTITPGYTQGVFAVASFVFCLRRGEILMMMMMTTMIGGSGCPWRLDHYHVVVKVSLFILVIVCDFCLD